MPANPDDWQRARAAYQQDWEFTLTLYRDLFPYVVDTLKDVPWDEYAKGGNSADERIRQLHTRARADFERLAGLPGHVAISISDEWRFLGLRVGLSLYEVEEMEFSELADRVRTWLLARKARAADEG